MPGTRGWKRRQQDLVRAHLNEPRPEQAGQTFAQLILTERIEAWLRPHRSETRHKLLSSIANRLLHQPELPAAVVGDPLLRVRWLLEELAAGIALTQTGNLGQKFVQSAAERFGWDFHRPPRSEDELYDLHQVRHLLQQLGLARRWGRKLALTAKGRAALADHETLWRTIARGVLPERQFGAFAGELFLAVLVDVDSIPYDDIEATVARTVAEEGFREVGTGEPPGERDVSLAIHTTLNLVRALGLLSRGADWRDRSYGLTEAGKAVALEALRARATGPPVRARWADATGPRAGWLESPRDFFQRISRDTRVQA